jgi:hypothetical protein
MLNKNKRSRKVLLSFLITLITIFSFIGSGIVEAYQIEPKEVTEEEVLLIERVNEAIEKTHKYIIENGTFSGDWKAVALSKAGYPIPKGYFNKYLAEKEEWAKKTKCYSYKVTDYERLALGITAAGGDPTNVAGHNLLEKIYNYHDEENPKRQLDFQGLNGVIYALIALDSNNYEIPIDAKYTREWMLDYIIGEQNDEEAYGIGSWTLYGYGNKGDVDITAMTLIALAPYHDYYSEKWGIKVSEAVKEACNWLSSMQTHQGGFNSWNSGNNSESCSQTIIGLCSNKIDPTCKEFTKDNNLIEYLLAFQQSNGEFYHILDGSSGENGMATEQAFQALIAYRDFYYRRNSLYDFTEHKFPLEI